MEKLTKTERQVAEKIAIGMTYKEIASHMFVSVHTIHTHLKNIRLKTGARNIADVTRQYILSLENPKLILKAMVCLFIHLGVTFYTPEYDMRKPQNRIVRVRRTISRLRYV